MKTDFRFVDMTAAPQGPGNPSIVFEREGSSPWYAAGGPATGPFEWVLTAEGGMVRVPLFRYQTNGRQPAVAMSFAFELGARCVLQAPCQPKRLFLAVGSLVADLAAAGGPDSLEFWIGLALQK